MIRRLPGFDIFASSLVLYCLVTVANIIDIVLFLLQEVVLSSEQDAFFKANMYENFGDLGMNIKRMVDEFQQVSKSNQNIQTIGIYRPSVFPM